MTQKIIPGYVYHKQFVLTDELNKLIAQHSNSESYYFLRYSHAVSGICKKLPDERGEIEGQVFNSICEIRWNKCKLGYQILILSQQEFKLEGFKNLTGNWVISDRDAHWYNPEETRFPKGFIFKDENNKPIKFKDEKNEPIKPISIKQRYFQDSNTATIHFVALTVN